MTVFRRKRTAKIGRRKIARRESLYSYDFEIDGQRYRGSTGLEDKADAEEWEQKEKKRIRRRNRGVAQDDPEQSMPMQEWAEEYTTIKQARGCAMGPIVAQLSVCLRFFGARPTLGTVSVIEDDAPYHDLTLGDVILDPYWVHRFDQWIRSRDVGWQTRNHYRSRMSDLYAVGSELVYRQRTGVTLNPFAGMIREPKKKRQPVGLTPAQLTSWIAHASHHARVAIALGALAPKLRRASIMALDFHEHIRYASPSFPRPRAIVIDEHKTDGQTGAPQVYPITRQLARVLIDAWRRNQARYPGATRVVLYRGKPVKDVEESVRAAALAAGLTWGRYGGITFHSLRHVASSMFARMDTNVFKHLRLMGWSDLRTPMYYTHVDAEPLREEAERLSAQFPIEHAVTAAHTRAKAHRPMVGTLATSRPGSKRYVEAQRDAAKQSKMGRKRKNA